jgi:TPR repeat protein
LAGVVLCLGVGWLAAGAFEVQHLDVLVGLVRDRILPRGEPAEASASLGAAPLPAAISWSSPNLAAAPPSAASAGRTTPESVTTGAGYPGGTPSPVPAPEPATQPGADAPRLSADDIAAFVARGDALLAAGDIASARLFFERAADAGDGRAAMRMAMTYDAAFLGRAGLRSLRNDPERAATWYRRARELGEGRADPPLGSLGTRTDSK